MNMVRKIHGWALASLLAVGAFTLATTPAQAGHHCSRCHYEWVISYVPQYLPYTRVIAEYDCYGYPHYVTKTYWKTVQVPVKKWVLVCY